MERASFKEIKCIVFLNGCCNYWYLQSARPHIPGQTPREVGIGYSVVGRNPSYSMNCFLRNQALGWCLSEGQVSGRLSEEIPKRGIILHSYRSLVRLRLILRCSKNIGGHVNPGSVLLKP